MPRRKSFAKGSDSLARAGENQATTLESIRRVIGNLQRIEEMMAESWDGDFSEDDLKAVQTVVKDIQRLSGLLR